MLDRNKYAHFNDFEKGGNIISDSKGSPDITIISTGSEVSLALEAQKELSEFNIRVVNLGCWELFDTQSEEYQQKVIDDNSFLVSIEAGITGGWQKYTGKKGLNIGIDRYGESAPGKIVADHLGMSLENIINRIRLSIKK